MTLKTLIDSDVADVFLNTDEFAETFEYTPKGGPPRSITACVVDEQIRFEKKTNDKRRMKEIQLLVANDAATGVTAPQPQDVFTRDADARVPKVPLLFIEVISQDAAAFLLRLHESPRHTRSGHSATSLQQ